MGLHNGLIDRDALPGNFLDDIDQLNRRVSELETAVLTVEAAAKVYQRLGENAVFDGWSVATPTSGQTAVILNRWGQTDARFQPWQPDIKSTITRLGVVMESGWAAGSLTVEVFIDGTVTKLTAVIDENNQLVARETADPGLYIIEVGEALTLRYTTDGSWTAATVQNVFIETAVYED